LFACQQTKTTKQKKSSGKLKTKLEAKRKANAGGGSSDFNSSSRLVFCMVARLRSSNDQCQRPVEELASEGDLDLDDRAKRQSRRPLPLSKNVALKG
jgi:hypothetical protein